MFKSYCLALSEYGPRVFPAEAFDAFCRQVRPVSWAALVSSPGDEKIFVLAFSKYAWMIKTAHRRGFGSQVQQK